MKWLVLAFTITLMLCSFISAEEFGYNYLEPGKNLNPPIISGTGGADGNASSICSGETVLLGNGSCQATSDFGGGGGSIDYTNIALTNQTNDFNSFNQTTTGWFNGFFNWVIAAASLDWLSFDGNELSFNETKLNESIDARSGSGI